MLTFRDESPADLSLGYDADVDARTGTATVSIPVPVTPGRSGFGPSLALSYSSSAGNSPFGVGWSLAGLPLVTVDASRKLPRWDGTEAFAFGGDVLVPWLEEFPDGWRQRGFTDAAWSVAYYRLRTGAAQIRVEKWVDRADGRVHFRTRDTRNVVTVYGARPGSQARVADPDDAGRTFAWLPEMQIDPTGNAVWFEYAAETLDGVDSAAPAERRRPALGQRYLKRIRYSNAAPLDLTPDVVAGVAPAGLRWCMQVVLDYGDHAHPQRPGHLPDAVWPVRPDAFSTGRPGFEVRTYRLCRRILMFHHVAELGTDPALVSSLELTHATDTSGSTLTSVRWAGHRADGGVPTARSIPPLRMTYAAASPATAFAPAEIGENVPGGFAGGRQTFVDLLGDGLPGILTESDRSWFFKRNEGDGRFGEQAIVPERPAVRMGTYGFGDVDGDGDVEVAALAGRLAGVFERDRSDGRWSGFRPLPGLPHVEALGPRAQWVDLNGDGRTDVVVPHEDRLTWFASDGDGFEPPVEVPLPAELRGSATMAEDASLNLFFADMNGDGLTDLVRVRDGRVEYWPSLGNGRFADPVVLDGSPQLSAHEPLAAHRLRFVDLDRSGTADLVYLGRGEVRIWHNASGNRLVAGPVLRGLPYLDGASAATVLDFLGDGRPTLVWSSPLPGRAAPIQYLPLAEGQQPRLLLRIGNGSGLESVFTYSTSARHYLRDLRGERPWASRLPAHVPVVGRLEVADRIGGTRSLQRFEYRDGLFDGESATFVGFGRVDVYDRDVDDGDDESGYVPAPSLLTRTWLHRGQDEWVLAAEDGYAGDAALPLLPGHVLADADDLTVADVEAAKHVVAGRVVRVERYAVGADGTPAEHPFDVVQTSYRVRRLQPASEPARAAFSVVQAETLAAEYEAVPDDPRVTHAVAVALDDHDVVTLEAEIAYPRRAGHPLDAAAQGELRVTVDEVALVHVDGAQRFEIGIPVEARRIELAGLTVPPGARLTAERLRQPDVTLALAAPLPHDAEPPPGTVAARLLSWERSRYWNDAQDAALPAGEIGSVALVHHEEAACFTPAFVAEVYGGGVDAMRLTALGYVLADGLWWRPEETHLFGGRALFHQRRGVTTTDGATTTFEYDAYALELLAVVDPGGLRTDALVDYVLLAPWRITDPNGGVSEVRYDELGIAVVTTARGAVRGRPWGFRALADVVPRAPAGLDALLADPDHFEQGASRYVWYDLDAWDRDGTPPVAVTLTREELLHDGRGGGVPNGRIAVSVEYHDGAGRALQEKTLVEPGDAIQRDAEGRVVVSAGGVPVPAPAPARWAVSGHDVYDDKQQLRRAYEPYFSPSARYEGDAVLRQFGVAPVIGYDALGREVERVLPNGTRTAVRYGPWSVEHTDANDNVTGSVYEATRAALPGPDPERQALEHARRHAGTAVVTFLDGLGSEVATVARGGTTAADRRQEARLDADGEVVAVVDPRGLVAFTYRRDMEGRALATTSVDAGESLALPDVRDRDVWTRNARGVEVERAYDLLGRPTTTTVRGLGLDHRVEEITYGDTAPDAVARNARGRAVRTRDRAGEQVVLEYDPAGRPLATTRRLLAATGPEPDWRAAPALDIETFGGETDYDGVGRPIRVVEPDGSVRRIAYARTGAMIRHTITTPDGALVDQPIVDGAAVDAHGRPTEVRLGNGTDVTFAYDPETGLLAGQAARRGSRVYQDVRYTRDPVGRVVRAVDRAHEGAAPLVSGTVVPARRDYEYDAHYRLVVAKGRVHQALLQHDHAPASGGFKGTRHITLNNGAALETFTRRYTYDPSGNLGRIQHVGASRSWTTDLWVSPSSNRSLPALDPGGTPVSDPEARFDAAGNLVAMDHLRAVEWSWCETLTRAVAIDRPGETDDDERYAYGSDLARVRKVTTRVVAGGTEVTEKVYLGGCERKRVLFDGAVVLERWTTTFAGGGDGPSALVHRWTKDDLRRETDVPGTRIHYQLAAHSASSSVEVAQNGDVISYEEFFPYGGTAFLAGDAQRDVALKEYRYSGKERDDATGLYYYGFRYYAPWVGRWTSPDPIGPGDDLNLYQFVLGDPVGNVDPDGLDTAPAGAQWLAAVRPGLSEARARAAFNAGRGIELGIQATRLRSLGDGNWLIVSYTEIPPRVLPYARRFNSVAVGETFAQLDEIKQHFAAHPPFGDPGGGGGGSANGSGGGSAGTGNPGTGAGGSGGQPGVPPGGDSASGNDPSAGGGPGSTTGDATGQPGGTGTGGDGTGRGRGLQGTGNGGGGTDPAGTGTGPTGTGTTAGTGAGGGTGAGTGTSATGGTGTPTGTGTGGTGAGGTGAGGSRGTGPGGTGTSGGGSPSGARGRPGGTGQGAGGEGTGGPGGDGDTGVSTGTPGGPNAGSANGVSNGVGGEGLPPQTGTGTAPVDSADSVGGTGTPNGGTSERTLGGSAENPGAGGAHGAGGSPTGSRDGERRGAGGTSGGSSNGTPGFREDALDTLTRWAGYANFEFGPGGGPGAGRRGVPGGRGRYNLGWFGQVAYIGLTAVSWLGPGAVLKGLRIGGRLAVRGVTAAGGLVRHGVGALARGGAAAARGLFRGIPQLGRLSANAVRARLSGGSLLDNNVLTAILRGDSQALRFATRNAGSLYINTRIATEAMRLHGAGALARASERYGIRVLPSTVAQARSLMTRLGISSAKRLNDLTVLATAERYGLRLVSGDGQLVKTALRYGWSSPAQLAARHFNETAAARVAWYVRMRSAAQQIAPSVNPFALTGSAVGR